MTISGFMVTSTLAEEGGYTFGDLMTGEEIKTTEETLDGVIMSRLFEKGIVTGYRLAVFAQVTDEGIVCDLLMTKYVISANPGMPFSDAARAAQTVCLEEGVRYQGYGQKQ